MSDPTTEPVVEGPPAEGELSKNQLKKIAKAKEAAEKKAAKAAIAAEKAAAEGPKKGKIGDDDEELDPTKYYENRMNSLAKHVVSVLHFVQMNDGAARFPRPHSTCVDVCTLAQPVVLHSLTNPCSHHFITTTTTTTLLTPTGEGRGRVPSQV